jgi:hypothetical protein
VTQRFGGDMNNLTNALEMMRANAYPYLAQHIRRIEATLEESPNAGGKMFDTLFDRHHLSDPGHRGI